VGGAESLAATCVDSIGRKRPSRAQGSSPPPPRGGDLTYAVPVPASSVAPQAATRCSSSRFAVTAYCSTQGSNPRLQTPGKSANHPGSFSPWTDCGLDVAHNLDQRKGTSSVHHRIGHQGVGDAAILSFAAWLRDVHAAAEAAGTPHPRFVYRLGVSSEDGKAGYAHVWNLVAQPDGSFHWLQSFINHYSLPSWLRQSDARSERHLPPESNPRPNPPTPTPTP
jgi:hypothetical protein